MVFSASSISWAVLPTSLPKLPFPSAVRDGIVTPQNSYVEALTRKVTVFGNGDLREVVKFN